jgi:glycosyltransferase involved in cell wall biosynthesis
MDVEAIIPAYNSPAEALRAAIASALGEPEAVRVLVVDDGSEPPLVLPEGIPAGERVRLLRQPNAGPSAARNAGIDAAEAEFLLFLDHDDVLLPGALGAALHVMQRRDAAAVVSGRYEERAGDRRLREAPGAWRDRLLPEAAEVFRPLAIFGASGLLVRREVARRVRFDPDLRIGEDREFLRRLADAGAIAVNSQPLLTVRLHDGGVNLTSSRHLARRVGDHLKILRRHHDAASDAPFREQTIWLLNTLARQRPLDVQSWRELRAAAAEYGWDIPLKCRVRAWRGALAHGR